VQLKKPGAPLILGSTLSIMDMKTAIFSYGAPEMSLLVAAQTEINHYYGLPTLGAAGTTDADVIGAQTGAEITYQILAMALSGADLVHCVGLAYHCNVMSPELIVFTDEVIGMVKVMMGGLEINDETLPLDLIECVGPGGDYLSQSHTLKHFRKFWVPTIFDRSSVKSEGRKNCEELLNEKTIEILKTHKPKPLPEDLVKELKKVEKSWFDEAGLDYVYPTAE
jgi:trimethylamine--corrinoid protein Co-methyltransferase